MSDLTFSEPQAHFDCLLDSILLLIFNRIGDVKALGRCCVVSRHFHSLVPQVDNVVVRVDCVISNDDSLSSSLSTPTISSSTVLSSDVMFMGLIWGRTWNMKFMSWERRRTMFFWKSFFFFCFWFWIFSVLFLIFFDFLLIKMLTCH